MKNSQSASSFKLERKTVEKNRRMHMKNLCYKLASVVPSQDSKRGYSVLGQLDQATAYIKNLVENLQVLKEKRRALAADIIGIDNYHTRNVGMMTTGLRSSPVIEVSDSGSTVDVLLITELNPNFTLSDVITVIEEEGATVVNATFSCAANKVFHIIHSQVTSSRVGFASARVHERLKKLIN